MVLSAQGQGAAALSAPVEIFALAADGRLRLMAAANTLTGESAIRAGLAFVEGGAEARHG